MTLNQFHNGIRVLYNIDKSDLDTVLDRKIDTETWRVFLHDPIKWFIQAPTVDAKALFTLVEAGNAHLHEEVA